MTITSLFHDLAAHEDSVERLKMAHEHDKTQVKVHSSAMNVAFHGSAPFTIYTMIATCPGTKTWWILKKRYSQFFSIRKRLVRHFKAASPALVEILSPALAMEFPKKHMLVSVDNKAIIKERKTQLQRFTAALIAIRASCILASLEEGRADKELAQLDLVFDMLQEFLEIPSTHDPTAPLSPESVIDERNSNTSASLDGCDSCSICLSEFNAGGATYNYQTPKHNAAPVKKVRFALEEEDAADETDAEEKVLRLPCNHLFHEECVMYWIEQKNSCPLCRADAFEATARPTDARVNVRPRARSLTGGHAFVVYTFVITCPSTSTCWVLKKRYSECHALRKQLVRLEKRVEGELVRPLRTALDMPFPAKHMFASMGNMAIIAERQKLLKHFVAVLVAIRATCLLTLVAHRGTATAPSEELYTLLQDFLEVPGHLRANELRQTVAIGSPDVAATYVYPEDPVEETCTLCLGPLTLPGRKSSRVSESDSIDGVHTLLCGHAFHGDCLLSWLEEYTSCPLCRADSLDKIKLAQAHDMYDAKVHASAMWYAPRGVTPFTIYTFIVSCPGTKAWWVIQKRFSQFYRLRKQLHNASLFAPAPVRAMLKDIMHSAFPTRHLGFDTTAIVMERKAALKTFTAKVIALRAACVLRSLDSTTDAATAAKLDTVYAIVQKFLEIPDSIRDEATFDVESPTSSESSDAPCDAGDACAICMTEFESDESVLKMSCAHSFHEDCIVHWFEQKLTCPLCRDEAIGGHVHTTATNIKKRGRTPFTVYTFTVSCHKTSTWWILQKRYSQIYAVRETLLSWRKQCKAMPAMHSLLALLDELAAIEFPRRHICFDHPTIIRQRKRELKLFIAGLIRLRYACLLLAQLPGLPRRKALDVVYLVLQFMEMPMAVQDEERRQSISSCDCQHAAKEDECPICLGDFDPTEDDLVLELTCGHAFHESCLVHWLDKNMTCPMCRATAVGGFIAAPHT
ncbi:hypothetical protein ACHHYP_03832 [Achlya hypogyna]|uniref:RING-type domain-containing protein n=1 Tax=Achlya hypogyna TaxID=1202772 RepID=A0A1V9Z2T5_ACHHY|nr:hypothetical protein ACHHYP_03832 [Achlya hypogyna]